MNCKPIIQSVWAVGAIGITAVLIGCSDKPEALLGSARVYLEKNDNKAAIIQIKNALQVDPDLSEARFLLGNALLETGDPVGAETELRKSMDLKYPKEAVLPQLVKTMLAQGQTRKVIDEFAHTQLQQPSSQADLKLSLAAAYAEQGHTDQSQAALNAALLADPAYPPALLEQARQLAAQQDFEGAHKQIESVIARSPKSHEAWKLQGDIYWLGQEQPKEALASYRKAIALKPDFMEGQAATVMLLIQQDELDQATSQLAQLQQFAAYHPKTIYLAGLLAFQKKDYKATREQIQQVLKVAPENIPALQLAGATELQLQNLPLAQDYLGRALQLAPGLPLARRLLVMSYLQSGQASLSLQTLLPGLEQDRPDPALVALAGEVYLKNGDLAKAEQYFSLASAQDPRSGKKKTALALIHMMSGPADAAFEELRSISTADPGITADMALISSHIKRREYNKALAAIDTLEQKQPAQPLAAYLRARVLLTTHDVPGAKANLAQAVRLDPAYFPALASQAALDLSEKRPDEAKKRFNALLQKDPKHEQALLALADIAASSSAPTQEVARLIGNAVAANPTSATSHLLLIDYHLRNKDHKAASTAAQNAAAALPNEPKILDALGRTQEAAGDLNQADLTFRKLADLLPKSALPHWRLANTQLAAKDKEGASASLRKAIAIEPDFLDAQRSLIAMHLSEGNTPDALALAQTVQKQRPRQEIGYMLEGDVHAITRNWDAAALAYRAGLKHVNTTTQAVKLHAVLLAAGKNTEAERFSASWQKEFPKDIGFEFYLGDKALERKDLRSAEKHYAAVLKQQASNVMALNNLAWVTGKLKKDGAIAYAEKANALAPNQPGILDTLATLRSENGDHATALELQTKALSLQPNNPMLKLSLAKIQLKAGKKDLARTALNELSGLGEAFPAQAEVATLLKEIGGSQTR